MIFIASLTILLLATTSTVEAQYVGKCSAKIAGGYCSCDACDAEVSSSNQCCFFFPENTPFKCVSSDAFIADDGECNPSGGGAGDPHIKKWNGKSYDYHGECDLILVSSPHFGSGTGLSVHIRTKIVDNWSFISSAAVKIGNDILEITNRGRFWVNAKKKVPTPTTLSGYKVSYKAATDQKHDKWHVFTVDLGNGQHVVIKSFNFQNMLAVNVRGASPIDFNGSGGLMGSFGSGVLLLRDGSTVVEEEDTNLFGQEWQVKDDDPQLFQWLRAPQWPAQCIVPSSKPSEDAMARDRRRLIEQVSYDQAAAACSEWGDTDKEYCIADVLATNDLELAKSGTYWE